MKKTLFAAPLIACMLCTSCNRTGREIPHENYNLYSAQIGDAVYSICSYSRGPYRIFPEIDQFDVLCSLPTCAHTGDCISNPKNTVCSVDTDGKNLYMFYTKLDAGDNTYKNLLLKFDPENQTQTELYEFPYGGYPAAAYYHDDYVYFYTLSEGNYYLTRINSSGFGKAEKLDIPYCSIYGTSFADDSIYYIENGVDIKRCDLGTGESTLIYRCGEENGEAKRIDFSGEKLYITYSSTLPGIEGGIEEYFTVNRTSELDLTTKSERFLNENSDTIGYTVSDGIIFYREFKRTPTGNTYFWTDPVTGETNEYLSLALNDEYSVYNMSSDETIRFTAPDAFICNLIGEYKDSYIVEADLKGNSGRRFYRLKINGDNADFIPIEGEYPQ